MLKALSEPNNNDHAFFVFQLFTWYVAFMYLHMLGVPCLHLWNETYLNMADDLFGVFLDLVCTYFVKNFCNYV